MKKLIFLICAAILIFGCTQPSGPIGGEKDSHGCLVAAGYSWCDAKQKCLRIWEENCTTACTQEAKVCPDGSAVGRTGPNCEFAPCPQIVGNNTDAHGCVLDGGYSWCEEKQKCLRVWEEPCEGAITVTNAQKIAQNSSCMDVGNLTGNYAYNNITKTWWFDLDTVKSGCSPACVVYEANQSAEVNWRCTGLIVHYTVKTGNVSGIGEVLTDGDGLTLYTFANDAVNKSTCSGTCANNWPPVLVTDTITIPNGLPGKIGFIIRDDATHQVTYNGMPLYRYASDAAPGDVRGQGVGGKWYAAKP
jgi:predicted lipoprotein with Yx(FWY)xxD motif